MRLLFLTLVISSAIARQHDDDAFDEFDDHVAETKPTQPDTPEPPINPATASIPKSSGKTKRAKKQKVTKPTVTSEPVESLAPEAKPEGLFRSMLVLTRADGSRYYFPLPEVLILAAIVAYVINYFAGSRANKRIASVAGLQLAGELGRTFDSVGVGDPRKRNGCLAMPLVSQSSPASFTLFASGGPQNIKHVTVELALHARQCLVRRVGGFLGRSPLARDWFGSRAETPEGIYPEEVADQMIIAVALERAPPLTGAILKRGPSEAATRAAWPDIRPSSLVTAYTPPRAVKNAVRNAASDAKLSEGVVDAACATLDMCNVYADGVVDGKGTTDVLNDRYLLVPEVVEALAQDGSRLVSCIVTDRAVALPPTVSDPKIEATGNVKWEPYVRITLTVPGRGAAVKGAALPWIRAALAIANAAGTYRPAASVLNAANARREFADKPTTGTTTKGKSATS